jgi:glucokinase
MKDKYSIGIGLNLFSAQAVLINEAKEVIASVQNPRETVDINDTFQVIMETFQDILTKAKKGKKNIEQVSLAIGGVLDRSKSIVYWPVVEESACSYIGIPFKKHLEKKFSLPVSVENDANACVWAEHCKNFPKAKNVLYLFSGVGCGMIINGELYRGSTGGAGELFISGFNRHKTSFLGEFSFLKQWPLDLGISQMAKEKISRGYKKTKLLSKLSSVGKLSVQDIFSAAAEGNDALAKEVIKEAAFALGLKASFLINLLNPELLIIGGGLEKGGKLFLDEFNKVMRESAFNEMSENLEVKFSQLGILAAPLGAALLGSRK